MRSDNTSFHGFRTLMTCIKSDSTLTAGDRWARPTYRRPMGQTYLQVTDGPDLPVGDRWARPTERGRARIFHYKSAKFAPQKNVGGNLSRICI